MLIVEFLVYKIHTGANQANVMCTIDMYAILETEVSVKKENWLIQVTKTDVINILINLVHAY